MYYHAQVTMKARECDRRQVLEMSYGFLLNYLFLTWIYRSQVKEDQCLRYYPPDVYGNLSFSYKFLMQFLNFL